VNGVCCFETKTHFVASQEAGAVEDHQSGGFNDHSAGLSAPKLLDHGISRAAVPGYPSAHEHQHQIAGRILQLVVSKSAVLVEGKLVTRVVSVQNDQGEAIYDIEEVDKTEAL
jgi:hypothetical protein